MDYKILFVRTFFDLKTYFSSFYWILIRFLPSNHAFICFRPFDSKNPFLASVTVNRRLNKGGSRHLMHLELDITGSKIRLVWFSCPLYVYHCLVSQSWFPRCVLSGMNRETMLPFSLPMTQLSWTSWDKSLEWTLTLLSLSTTLMVICRIHARTLILCVVTRLRLRDYAIPCPVAKLHRYHCNPVFITQGPQSHTSVTSLTSFIRFPCMYV